MNKITQQSRPKPEESSLHRRRRSRWNRLHRLVIGVYSAVLLSSCSGLAQVSSSTSALSEAYPGALSGESQLVAGTLLLEETDLAVTAEQASELHLLWMAFRSLNSSETSAQAEIDAVLAQIEDSMSSEQLEAIAGMQLTSEDMSELSARYTVRTADSTDSIAVDGLSGAQVGPAGGAPPDGGGPAGAIGVGVPGGGMGSDPMSGAIAVEVSSGAAETDSTQASLTSADDLSSRAALLLIDPLTELLEVRSAA